MDDNQASMPSPFEKQEEDSDWEYEYDDTEVESFYVTVDVSSHSQHGRVPKKIDPLFPTSLIAQDSDGRAQPSTDIPIDPALQDASPSEKPEDPKPQDRIQILDLHTRNPLISYDDRIYSCNWASTFGTDIFLASPKSLAAATVDGEKVTPIYTHPDVFIIGTSCVNLTAKPVTITPRTDDAAQSQPVPPEPTTNTPPVPSPPNLDSPQSTSPIDPAQQSRLSRYSQPQTQIQAPRIPLSTSNNPTTRAQASFLESLIAIKASRGEQDQVTVHATKQNHGTGWRAQRRVAAEESRAAGKMVPAGDGYSNDDDDNDGETDDESDDESDDDDDDDDMEAMDLAYANLPSMRSTTTARTTITSPADANTIAGAADPDPDREPQQEPPKKRGRGGRPRGSRGRARARARVARPPRSKTRAYRRKAVPVGGLFRDYVPGDADVEGVDGRGDSTPQRWEELEGRRGGDEGEAVAGGLEGEGEEGADGDVRMEDVRMKDVG
ncbi:MAG: hypothetical protein Q9169_002724 [Polycauliona sp. 2 TL-2023]